MTQGRADGSVLIEAKLTQEKFKQGLTSMEREASSFAKNAAADFNSVTRSSLNLVNALKAGAAAFAGWKITTFVKDAALAAARYETLGIVAQTAGANIGKSGEQVEQYEKDLRNMGIAALEARQNIARMAAAGIDLDFGGQIARAAQDLAVVGDLNSSEAFTRMIRGIQSGEQEILKTMGLNVQWEEGYKSLAKQLSKTTEQLSAQEKVQSRVNTVLQASAAYSGIYEASMATAGKQLSSLSRIVSDFSVKAGGVFLDALATGVSGFTDVLKEANSQLDEMEKSGALAALGQEIGANVKGLAENWNVAAVALGAYVVSQKLSTSETAKQVLEAARLNALQVQGKAVILDSTQATLMKAKVEQASALAALESAKAELAKVEATLAGAVATTNATQSEFARLAVEKQLALLKGRLVSAEAAHAAATNAVDVAQKKATFSARTLAAAQSGLGKLATGLKNIVNMLGGPWVLGFTAAAAAVTYLSTRQSALTKYTKENAGAFLLASENTKEAADALEEYEKKLSGLSKKQIDVQLVKISSQMKEFARNGHDLAKAVSSDALFNFTDTAAHEVRAAVWKMFQPLGNVDILDIPLEKLEEIRERLDDLALENPAWLKELEETKGKLSGIINLKKQYEVTAKARDTLTESTEKGATASAKAAKDVEDLSGAIQKLNDAQKVDSAEDAIKFLDDLTKGTDAAKKSSIELRKEKAQEAIALLEGKIAATEAAAGQALLNAQMAAGRGETEAAARYLRDYAEYLDVAARAQERLSGYKTAISDPKFNWSGSSSSASSGKKLADVIKELDKEIASLKDTTSSDFAKGLQDGLDRITEKFKDVKGATKDVVAGFQNEFRQAFATDYLEKFNREIMELEGNTAELARLDIGKKIDGYKLALKELGVETEEIAVKGQHFRDLLEKQVNMENLQEQLGFFRELGDLSGNYGLALETQNKLIAEQAERYKELFKGEPELQKMVDLWVRLQKRESATDWTSGWERSADKWVAEWTNAAKQAERQFGVLTAAVDSLGTSVVDSIFDGAEFRVDDLFKDIAKQLMKMAMNQAIAGLVGSIFGTQHTGGIVGTDSGGSKRVSPLVFAGAPKYHAGGIVGLTSGEVPIIAKAGEGVFTAAQMRALAPVGSIAPIVNVNITNEIGDRASVAVQQTQSVNGGLNLEVLVRDIYRSDVNRGGIDGYLRAGGFKRPAIAR